MPGKLPLILNRLILFVTAVALTGLCLTLPQQNILAQADATATPASGLPVVTVAEPDLSPPYAGNAYPNGWLKIFGKSAYTVYLAINADEETGGAFTGVWRPVIPLSGSYQVSIYLGVAEFGEYRALYPDVLPSEVELTHTAVYQINHAQGVSTQILDQSDRDSGWVDLGVFLLLKEPMGPSR